MSFKRKLRIAVVDDEKSLCKLYFMLLTKKGHDVVFSAINGEEIVSAITQGTLRDLDIILLDQHLGAGKMKGLQAAFEIKTRIPKVKIIMVTADSSIKTEVVSAGLSFLLKPFTIEEFLKTIEQTMGKKT